MLAGSREGEISEGATTPTTRIACEQPTYSLLALQVVKDIECQYYALFPHFSNYIHYYHKLRSLLYGQLGQHYLW